MCLFDVLFRDVPYAYSWLAQSFLSQGSKVLSLLEWRKRDWTFHCKGLWYVDDDDHHAPVAVTVVGSSNFGNRSVQLDLEAQAILWSENEAFRATLVREMGLLTATSRAVSLEELRRPERRLPWYWKALLPVIKRFM